MQCSNLLSYDLTEYALLQELTYGTYYYLFALKGSKRNSSGSTVRLRTRKSISGHHFQNSRKLDNKDLQYHRDVIYSV